MIFFEKIKGWYKSNKDQSNLQEEYVKTITKSFPKYLKEDVEKVISITLLNTFIYINSISRYDGNNIDSKYQVQLLNETIILHKRIHFNEPNPQLENRLTETQKQILNCIYTRHINGYIRERRLQNLKNIDYEWVLPFKIQLLGEPVIQVLTKLEKQISDKNVKHYKRFVLANKKFWQQKESKARSWWLKYYKNQFHLFEDYTGYKIISRIKRTNL